MIDLAGLKEQVAEALETAGPEESKTLLLALEAVTSTASPAGWAQRASSAFLIPRHVAVMDEAVVDLVEGTLGTDKLMICMPPRHGKSEMTSKYTPAWFLSRYPDRKVMLCSYEAEFAATWGRKVRDLIKENEWSGVSVKRTSSSAKRWDLEGRDGGMITAGVGGSITGRGAHLLGIDDPVKNAEEARSKTYRERAWEWYQQTAFTRLEPGGKVMVTMCMTGDTQVLMADGSEHSLCDVRPGDSVATYENGALCVSTVRQWADQGLDRVYLIRMRSGAEVRANARHPFLTIQNGVETWQRTDALQPGTTILRATGGNIAAWNARTPDAGSRPNVRECACRTTSEHVGPLDIDPPRPTPYLAEQYASRVGTESPQRTICASWNPRTECVPSADNHQNAALRPTGTASSVSTTITTPAECEACSAMTATLPSDMASRQRCCGQPLSIFQIEYDVVVEVLDAGVEDVFDVQIDRTENFIANGLVSHNTRWHEDDLGGRLLANEPGQWTVINLPALAEGDDPLGREPGEALWPERYDAEQLALIRSTIGPQAFGALYQQHPTPLEGGLFKRDSLRYYDLKEGVYHCGEQRIDVRDTSRFITVDLAVSTKTRADFTVISVWGVSRTKPGELLWLDMDRRRMEGPDHLEAVVRMRDKWHPDWIGVEKATYGISLLQAGRRAGVAMRELSADKDKITRAMPAASLVQDGRFWLPRFHPELATFEDELLTFDNGVHDDIVDTFAYAAREISKRKSWARASKPKEPEGIEQQIWKQLQEKRKGNRHHPVLGKV